MDDFYAFLERLWITFKNREKYGFLSPESVDNRVENVDFHADHTVHIHAGYTFLRHIFCAGHIYETSVTGALSHDF